MGRWVSRDNYEPSKAGSTMALIGYGRVSTKDQDVQLQRDALTEAGCGKIFEEVMSGKSTANRPELARMLDYVRDGDTIVVWKLDRAARSARDLHNLVHDLNERGIGLRILTGAAAGLDTSRADGKMFFGMLAVLAEFERELLVERTNAGLKAAKAQGRVGGRPKSVSEDKLAAARARRERGESLAEIARALQVSKSALHRALTTAETVEAAAVA